jgi:4-aminobutyrate aminotransferase-like enzyme
MLENATRMGAYLLEKFEEMKKDCPCIKEVRGLGLMIGLELFRNGKPVVDRCLAKGLLINCTHDTVLRLMPALNVTRKQADTALKILESVLREVV